MECPTVLATPLSLGNRHSVTNARQIFEGNAATSVLGCRPTVWQSGGSCPSQTDVPSCAVS
jgi:hypothetical protein